MFLRLMHNEAKQYQNVGVWSRERFTVGPNKEHRWVVSHKASNSWKVSSKPSFLRPTEGGAWLVVTNFLVSESTAFAASHIGQVMMFL